MQKAPPRSPDDAPCCGATHLAWNSSHSVSPADGFGSDDLRLPDAAHLLAFVRIRWLGLTPAPRRDEREVASVPEEGSHLDLPQLVHFADITIGSGSRAMHFSQCCARDRSHGRRCRWVGAEPNSVENVFDLANRNRQDQISHISRTPRR